MGGCCSSPVVVEGSVDIRADPIDSPRHHADVVNGVVDVLATVQTTPHERIGAVGHHHHQHHHHQQQHDSRDAAVHNYSSRGPKQLLRAVSPQQQQQPYGLSPRSLQQLQQLLPSEPLQHLAQGQAQQPHDHLPSHDKETAQHSTRAGGGLADAMASRMQQHNQADLRSSIDKGSISNASLQQLHSDGSAVSNTAGGQHGKASVNALGPLQVLAVCAVVVQEDTVFQAAGITPLLLASLCLIESGGNPQAKQFREHLGDTAHGLCQMGLSTAQWLASSEGFDRHGSTPSIKDLESPKACAYFAAAYLLVLSQHGGSPRSEGFVIRAYHAGPKGVDTAEARSYLQKYLKAKHCLTEVTRAAAVTLAAAALAAEVQLPAPEAAAAAGPAAELCADAGVQVTLQTGHDEPSKDQDSTSKTDSSASGGCSKKRTSCDSSTSSSTSRQVTVRRVTADLVATLCSTYDDAGGSAGGSARHSTGLGASSILAHMIPSRWSLSGSKQQQGQHTRAGSAGNGGTTAAEHAMELVCTDAASLGVAWQRVVCISPVIACAAMGQAAAAADMAPHPQQDWPPRSSRNDTPAAAPARPSSHASTRRNSTDSSGAGCVHPGSPKASGVAAAAAAATLPTAGQALESMPCVMHVVGQGETLQRIARVCNLGVADLLAANPEVCGAEAVRHNDCIAVPLPAVFPRLYVMAPGDTLHSIARAHSVPLGRVLAKNPELQDPARVQPGWVVALPGLKGDSQAVLPLDWLTQAPLSVDLAQPAAGRGVLQQYAGAEGARINRDCWPQQRAAVQPQQRRQQVVVEATSRPTGSSTPQRQRSRQQRHRHKQSPAPHDPTRDGAAPAAVQAVQQQQHLPPVGTGAFLFIVGDHSNTIRPWLARPSAAQAGRNVQSAAVQ